MVQFHLSDLIKYFLEENKQIAKKTINSVEENGETFVKLSTKTTINTGSTDNTESFSFFSASIMHLL